MNVLSRDLTGLNCMPMVNKISDERRTDAELIELVLNCFVYVFLLNFFSKFLFTVFSVRFALFHFKSWTLRLNKIWNGLFFSFFLSIFFFRSLFSLKMKCILSYSSSNFYKHMHCSLWIEKLRKKTKWYWYIVPKCTTFQPQNNNNKKKNC